MNNINDIIWNSDNKILSELKREISFKILNYNYNYITGEWGLLLEKCEIELISKKIGNKNTIHIISKSREKKNKIPDININISDLAFKFLYTTLNNWFNKYNALQKDYSEIKKYKFL